MSAAAALDIGSDGWTGGLVKRHEAAVDAARRADAEASADQWAETVDALMDTMADNFAKVTTIIGDTSASFCDDGCGCLVVPGERCPSCLVWAERDAVKASWRTAHRTAAA